MHSAEFQAEEKFVSGVGAGEGVFEEVGKCNRLLATINFRFATGVVAIESTGFLAPISQHLTNRLPTYAMFDAAVRWLMLRAAIRAVRARHVIQNGGQPRLVLQSWYGRTRTVHRFGYRAILYCIK